MITGGASGIGQTAAEQMSERGMQVVLAGADAPKLREVPLGRVQHAGQNPLTSIDDLGAECALAQT